MLAAMCQLPVPASSCYSCTEPADRSTGRSIEQAARTGSASADNPEDTSSSPFVDRIRTDTVQLRRSPVVIRIIVFNQTCASHRRLRVVLVQSMITIENCVIHYCFSLLKKKSM